MLKNSSSCSGVVENQTGAMILKLVLDIVDKKRKGVQGKHTDGSSVSERPSVSRTRLK